MADLATRTTSGINKRGAWLLRKDARTHSQPVKHHTPTPGHPARRATTPRLARTADPATRAPVPSAHPTARAPPTPNHHHPHPPPPPPPPPWEHPPGRPRGTNQAATQPTRSTPPTQPHPQPPPPLTSQPHD